MQFINVLTIISESAGNDRKLFDILQVSSLMMKMKISIGLFIPFIILPGKQRGKLC